MNILKRNFPLSLDKKNKKSEKWNKFHVHIYLLVPSALAGASSFAVPVPLR